MCPHAAAATHLVWCDGFIPKLTGNGAYQGVPSEPRARLDGGYETAPEEYDT